jgi:hypothetical protein
VDCPEAVVGSDASEVGSLLAGDDDVGCSEFDLAAVVAELAYRE